MGESDPRAYEPDRLARAGVPVGETKVQVLAVVNGFVKKLRHMRVVEAVDDATACPVAHDQAEIPQHSKLMRDGGIRLQSGRELAADISITATGLNLLAFGGINLSVDGVAVDVAEKVAFKGFLLSDVSNFAGPHGRTRAHHLLSAAARSHADPAAAGRRSPLADLKVLREGPVDDDHLRFTTSASASRLTVKRITRSTPWN